MVWATTHDRRELDVGASTAIVLLGNKIAPGLGDHYLAETGFDSQMTDEPEDRGRPDNLWAPVPGDFGAHGVFDDRAKNRSFQLRVVTSGLGTEARQVGDWISSKITGRMRRKPRDAHAGFDLQNRSDSAPRP